ncbi:MAG: hypothetical protein WBP54_11415 [Pelodictyon phaeoclathratiforme]
MITLTINYDILPDRLVTIKLPEEVPTGRHDLVIVLDEKDAGIKRSVTDTEKLMQFAGTVTAFKNIDGIAYQREVRSEWN